MQVGYRIIGDMGHINCFFPRGQSSALRCDSSSPRSIDRGYDRGGWGASCRLGIGLLVIWVILIVSSQEARAAPFAATLHLLDQYSIGLERMVRLVQTAQF